MKAFDSYASIEDYDLYIVDLDGTLYRELPVKIRIMLRMLARPWKVREYITVGKYRKMFRKGLSEKERLAGLSEEAERIIDAWMFRAPLPLIHRYRSQRLIAELGRKAEAGKTVVVYSDYPIRGKLKALDFVPTKAYDSDSVGAMKPNPAGIKNALMQDGLYSESCLVIGNRDDKDKALAKNLGVDALIAKKFS